jgi:ribosomal protein L20A (L18A)
VSTVAQWTIIGSFHARRNFWQGFQKTCEAGSAVAAREWAYSQIGGCHRVKRGKIRIDSVAEA